MAAKERRLLCLCDASCPSLPRFLFFVSLSLSLSSLVFFLHLCPYPCVTLTEASETLHSDLENQRMSGSVEKASIFGAWVVARTYICVANITPCSNPLCARAGTDAVVHALYAMLCRAVVQRGTSNSADACAANNSWATKKPAGMPVFKVWDALMRGVVAGRWDWV